MRMAGRLAACIVVLLVAVPAAAQKADSGRSVPPVPPTINASEDTPIDYGGGEPPLFTGALDADDSTHTRAATCTELSMVGFAVAFDTVTITNNSPGPADFTVFSSLIGGGECPNTNDTFFVLYDGSFDPANPLVNCLEVNDDITPPTNRCSVLVFPIPVGETRVVVITSFLNPPIGIFDYQINFTGTTPVELLGLTIE